MSVDLLAIAAHRDDVELTCAGTLVRAADSGYATGILDLTAGETGTRGSATEYDVDLADAGGGCGEATTNRIPAHDAGNVQLHVTIALAD